MFRAGLNKQLNINKPIAGKSYWSKITKKRHF